MKTLKNRKWFALQRKQRAPKIQFVKALPITYVEVVETDEILKIIHIVEHHAWDRDGICLLKEDYKKIAHIPFNRLIAYAGRLEKGDVRIFADSLKVGLARRWVSGPVFPKPRITQCNPTVF